MYFPNVPPTTYQLSGPHTIPTYGHQQQFLVQPAQQNMYPQGNFVPMSITSQTNQGSYMGMPNTPNYSDNVSQPSNYNQQGGRNDANLMATTPTSSDDERYRKQLIVNYLAADVTSAELHGLFSRFGPLDGARIIYDRQTSLPRGFGFVYFRHPESAKKAVESMNGYQFHNKRLKVSYSTNPLNIISSSSLSGSQVSAIQ